MPSGENQVGIIKHAFDPRQIFGRAANTGCIKNRSHIRGLKREIVTIFNHVEKPSVQIEGRADFGASR
jgi:hypothetical protein